MFINKNESGITQSCLNLCNPVNCNLPGSTIGGIFQARVLQWIGISFSRGSSPQGTEPGSPAFLQADALPSEPSGKPTTMQNITAKKVHVLIKKILYC